MDDFLSLQSYAYFERYTTFNDDGIFIDYRLGLFSTFSKLMGHSTFTKPCIWLVRYTGNNFSLLETIKVVCNEKIGGSWGVSVDSFEHD